MLKVLKMAKEVTLEKIGQTDRIRQNRQSVQKLATKANLYNIRQNCFNASIQCSKADAKINEAKI